MNSMCLYCSTRIDTATAPDYSIVYDPDYGICHADCHYGTLADHEFWENLGKPRYVVTVWDCDREIGGPEEDGWSYETGRLVTSIELTRASVAERVAEALRDEYPYTGKRGYYSKREADYSVRVLDRNDGYDLSSYFDERLDLIGYYPLTTPHYC